MGKGEQTRVAILDKALGVASRTGLGGLSIGGLAKEVGLSKSGLFAHFNSKQNLQRQVMETALDRFVETVVSPSLKRPRGEPRLRALFENWFRWSQDNPGGCLFVATANELDDRPGPLREYLVQAQQDWLSALSTAARIAVEEGHFYPDLDTDQFAYEMYSALLAFHLFHRLLRDPQAEERSRLAFERLIEAARWRSS